MPASTPKAASASTAWSPRRGGQAPRCSWRPTSSTGPGRWHRVSSPWRGDRSGWKSRRGPSVWRDTAVMAGKDLRIELRSRVATNQVAPFALLVLILFAFALDPDRGVLSRAAAGLFWVAVLFCALLAIQRAFAVEATDGARDNLRLSGLDPAGIFVGKASAIAAELAVLEV